MHPIISIDKILEITQGSVDVYHGVFRRMVGILFLKPHSKLIADEIIECGE